MPEMNPTRREFLSVAAAAAAGSGASAATQKPNVLYVFGDEHRACSLPGEPYSDVAAPNFERFAKQGMSFRNCISNYPVCSPYRAMLLTGRWPHQTGITDNALPLRPDGTSLADTFRSAGYRTGYVGKWHLTPGDEGGQFIPKGPDRQGFDDWHVWSHTNNHHASFTFDPDTGRRIETTEYNATGMTNQALDLIDRHRDRPWMLMMSWNPPHSNFLDAPAEYRDRYDPAALRLRPNVKAGPQLRQTLRGYYGHLSAIDAEFGRLLRKLDETGQADRTIVVYSSDHGSMMGSHGLNGKRVPWDESCRVPFLVRYPGVVKPGSASDCLLSTIDLYPTLCGAAGLKPPSGRAGRDLSAVMRGKSVKLPESAFLMHIAKEHATGGNDNPAPLFRGVRTATHTYAVAADGRWCLYDNRGDPYQTRNLIDDAGSAKLCRDMDGLVLDWLRKAGDPFPYEATRKQRSALA